MASGAVRFHPAAAQEAESTYDWNAARSSEAAHGFREELRLAIDAVAASPPNLAAPWQPRAPVRISEAPLQPRVHSSRWPTVVVGPATGGCGCDRPSNFRMRRVALRAAADADR
jgi:plasmid stabilization system protein ParE